MKYDVVIVGAGFAGATVANAFLKANKEVLLIEKRSHIGGNAYDEMEDSVLVHEYGPHIFHTNSDEVMEYLSQFSDFYEYRHKVLGHIQDKVVPIPFNLTSLEECFEAEKAARIKERLIDTYGFGNKVTISELRKNDDPDVKELAEFVFENVFKHYTMKQWGYTVEELDPAVIARVPVNISYDDHYFVDKYQCMPKEGYTKIFEKMLDSINLKLMLDTEAKDVIKLDEKEHKVYVEGELYEGPIVYTGAVDELLDYKFDDLPYRTLDLVKHRVIGTYQKGAVENYGTPKEINAFTRITEYKHFMESCHSYYSYIHKEYPLQYQRGLGFTPYYPINNEANQKQYDKYVEEVKKYNNIYLLGRLAEYKYYNMDQIILKALELSRELLNK
jgi:UDP-galactopyranose mutase